MSKVKRVAINSEYFIETDPNVSNDALVTNLFDKNSTRTFTTKDPYYGNIRKMYQVLSSSTMAAEVKENVVKRIISNFNEFKDKDISDRYFVADNATKDREADASKVALRKTLNDLINFFKEFQTTPSFRFVNTLALTPNKITYVRNYFLIQDNPHAASILEKIQSKEFNQILKGLTGMKPKEVVNKRLDIYYGEPGGGKTTLAEQEAKTTVVCSSDMLPSDLLQNFNFNDGKAAFEKAPLWKAMEEGTIICLDEINMLPFESLRFLQGITDGKKSINFKGYDIKIKDGFKIIGTMNLNVNGQTIPLPSPLVDRCGIIKEFIVTADQLMETFF